MYFNNRPLAGGWRTLGNSVSPYPGLRPRLSYTFGEALPSPKGLALFEHFHTPKEPDSTTPGRFIIKADARLDVKDVNPGFINASDALVTDTGSTGLQTCLHKLITTQFQNFLGARGNKAPSGNDRIRVGLVDLTGDKRSQPDFAGWGSTVSMYGASVPKILALYAAQQLRRDMRQLAAAQSITDGRTLETTAIQNWKLKGLKSDFPDLVWLFDIRKWSSGSDLTFTTAATATFAKIADNCPAGELISRVGFPYIGSLAWQSGLRHPTRSGLWLGSGYCNKGSWAGNPIPSVSSNAVTALSAATYFTLLAQGRLVDDASSTEITTALAHGCVTSLFPSGLGVVASKCGIWSDYVHDCVFVSRSAVSYVVIGLTRLRGGEGPAYTKLFSELDKLIVQNNQSPKPGC